MAALAGVPRRHLDLRNIVLDACAGTAVTYLLALPIVGFQTVGASGQIILTRHFGEVALCALAAFILRIAYRVLYELGAFDRLASTLAPVGTTIAGFSRPIAYAALAGAVALPFVTNNYYIDLGTSVLIYIMLGWGLNIVVGLAGLLDLGYVAFYAVGAYTVGLLATNFGFGFWACLPLAGLFAASFGVMLGFPVLRLRGDYLAIVTLGFGEIIRVILLNWSAVTQGPNGIGGIPRPSLFGLDFVRASATGGTTFADFFGFEYAPVQRQIFLYFVIMVLAMLTNLFTLRMRRLPVGRAWEALREDEIACRAIGINATNVKLSAFGIGAMFAGFAGAFFATRQGFISPESFTFTESATILAIVVLGGMGSQMGVVLAATLLVVLPELAREFAQYRMLLFGAAMVAIMVLRPRGLLAHRHPSILLRKTS
jgi:branched-chain amino acid transport system permease protein